MSKSISRLLQDITAGLGDVRDALKLESSLAMRQKIDAIDNCLTSALGHAINAQKYAEIIECMLVSKQLDAIRVKVYETPLPRTGDQN